MESPSYLKLGIFSMYSSSTNRKSSVPEAVSNIVKPQKRFSVPFNDYSTEDADDYYDRLHTKDTDSETKEHRDDSERASLTPNRSSGIFTSRQNSARDTPKSILKTPKFGALSRNAVSIPTLQSFVDTKFTDGDDDRIYSTGSARISAAPRLESAHRSRHGNLTSRCSIAESQSPVKKAKKVTFAKKIAESESIPARCSSAQQNQKPKPFSFGMASSPIKPVNNFFSIPSYQGAKVIPKNFTFSSDELSKIKSLVKEKNTLREEAVSLPKRDLEVPVRLEMSSSSPCDPYGLKPKQQAVRSSFNLRLPLTLTASNGPKSCERLSSLERPVATPRLVIKQGPLSSRGECLSSRRDARNVLNLKLAKSSSSPVVK